MLPELNYIEILRNTKFPFFVLPSDDVRYEDGLVTINEKVVDDRNQRGVTLGQRRLLTPHKKQLLKKCVFDFPALIDTKEKYFIDTRGRYFCYTKTKMIDVVSYRITRKMSHEYYSTIKCKGINNIYVLPSFPHSAEWAQILELDGLPWRLYSISDNCIVKYKRKI